MALKDAFDFKAWNQWPEELRLRHPEALEQARAQHAPALHAHRFMQWVFDRQWKALRDYGNQRGIRSWATCRSSWLWIRRTSGPRPTCSTSTPESTDGGGRSPAGLFLRHGTTVGQSVVSLGPDGADRASLVIDRLRSALARHDLVRIDHFGALPPTGGAGRGGDRRHGALGPGPRSRLLPGPAASWATICPSWPRSGGHHPGGPGSARRVRTARHEGAAVRFGAGPTTCSCPTTIPNPSWLTAGPTTTTRRGVGMSPAARRRSGTTSAAISRPMVGMWPGP